MDCIQKKFYFILLFIEEPVVSQELPTIAVLIRMYCLIQPSSVQDLVLVSVLVFNLIWLISYKNVTCVFLASEAIERNFKLNTFQQNDIIIHVSIGCPTSDRV